MRVIRYPEMAASVGQVQVGQVPSHLHARTERLIMLEASGTDSPPSSTFLDALKGPGWVQQGRSWFRFVCWTFVESGPWVFCRPSSFLPQALQLDWRLNGVSE